VSSRLRPLLLLTLLIPAGHAGGAEANDVQDVVLLADVRPALLRLHVLIDAQPYRAAWERYLDKLFADLDRDGDGSLSRTEAVRVPSAEFLRSFLQGGLNLEAARASAPFTQLDADRDGRISRRELGDYYRKAGLADVRVVLVPDRGNAGALTDALFRRLDRDGDGKLSREELLHAADALRIVDLNEDEWITPAELLALHDPKDAARTTAQTLESVGFVPRSGEPLALLPLMRKRYKNLDERVLTHPPETEVILRLGRVGEGEKCVEVLKSPRGNDTGPAPIVVDGLALDLEADAAAPGVRGLHAYYLQQFDAAGGGADVLDRKQAEGTPALAALFRLGDRDGDGRLTAAEFAAFLNLHALGAVAVPTISVTERSLGLFELLDEVPDNRLSLRELHTAWDRLKHLDRDGDGKLSRDEFPRRLHVRFSRGKPGPAAAPRVDAVRAPAPRGPEWFRKMDRNGDGYVSRREFLGSDELFSKLDTDGDGLISPEEAERLPVPPARPPGE
jgi:Ca2+-binding EF-hand superfamily protein